MNSIRAVLNMDALNPIGQSELTSIGGCGDAEAEARQRDLRGAR
jgi:hypothetical protein